MLFNSLSFVVFLPIVFCLYWILPHKYRWVLLLLSSYYFYMSWNIKYVFLILFVTVISYCTAIILEKTEKATKRKILISLSILSSLFILFIFKYFNFFFESVNSIVRIFSIQLHPITLNLILPVGISFYTFQTISYVVDVSKGNIKAEKNFGVYATFVSFFPQLVAGPIERTSNLLPQIKQKHYFNCDKAISGVQLMLWGYFKKLVIADNVAIYVDMVYDNIADYKGFDIILIIFLFSIQIYCDFSGYSDIALGTARLLDIDLMTNFKSPYFSGSVREFWSRWHISLTTWFRDYVYIPMGGNRVGKIKHYTNIMITFLLSGLWHGANWTFVIWGGIHGLAEIFELQFYKKKRKEQHLCKKIAQTIFVFCFCNIAWVFFRGKNLSDVEYVLCNMFNGITNTRNYFTSNLLSPMELLGILTPIGILAMYDLVDYKIGFNKWLVKDNKIVRWLFYLLIGLLIVFSSRKGVAADFVYFQF